MGNCCACCTVRGNTKSINQVAGGPVIFKKDGRSCTDVLFFLAYLAMWVIVIAIFATAGGQGGNPQRIIRGVDMDGNICGKSTATKSRPLAVWVYPPAYTLNHCVASCNFTQSDKNYMLFNYESTQFLNWCIPGTYNASKTLAAIFDVDEFESASALATRAIGDMLTAWPVILVAAGVALILSYVYVWLSKYIGRCMVYIVIMLILGAGLVLGFALWEKAKDVEDSADTNNTNGSSAKAMKVLAGITWGLTAVVFLILVFLRDRIEIAIEVVIESARALGDMKLLIVFPLIPFAFVCAYFVYWIAESLYIFTVGDYVYEPIPQSVRDYQSLRDSLPSVLNYGSQGYLTTNRTTYASFDWDDSFQGAFAAHLFHLLWNINFVVYFCYITTAGAVANWYFSRPADPNDLNHEHGKKRGDGPDELPDFAVQQAAKRSLRYHLGTIALGAMIIAIIQFIRAVVAYLEKKSKGQKNRLQKAIFCMIQCCLKCLQCCMDKINKNAFVWCAIWGDNFIVSACSSFSLIWSNLARVAALNMVSGFIMLMGRVLVALATTGVCGFIMEGIYGDDLTSIVMPSVVIFVLSFMVASMFMVVVETTTDTIFMCFLVDESITTAGHRPYYPKGLRDLVDKHHDKSRQLADDNRDSVAKRPQVEGDAQSSAAPTTAPATFAPSS